MLKSLFPIPSALGFFNRSFVYRLLAAKSVGKLLPISKEWVSERVREIKRFFWNRRKKKHSFTPVQWTHDCCCTQMLRICQGFRSVECALFEPVHCSLIANDLEIDSILQTKMPMISTEIVTRIESHLTETISQIDSLHFSVCVRFFPSLLLFEVDLHWEMFAFQHFDCHRLHILELISGKKRFSRESIY